MFAHHLKNPRLALFVVTLVTGLRALLFRLLIFREFQAARKLD